MAKNPMDTPKRHGEDGPSCPDCGSPTVARVQQGTGKLYFGCTNFKGGCRFNGCRDIQPQELAVDAETKRGGNQSMTEKHSKKVRYHWLLWWKIEPEELERQVIEYDDSLVLASARGISAELLMLYVAATIIFVCVGWTPARSLVDAIMAFGLAVFVYRGHRWAMICAMVYWTLEQGYLFLNSISQVHSGKGIMAVILWTGYMQVFYMAYRVEKERRAAPVPVA